MAQPMFPITTTPMISDHSVVLRANIASKIVYPTRNTPVSISSAFGKFNNSLSQLAAISCNAATAPLTRASAINASFKSRVVAQGQIFCYHIVSVMLLPWTLQSVTSQWSAKRPTV